MIRIICSISLVLSVFSVRSNPYRIGKFEAVFIDSSRNNRLVSAEIFYPTHEQGNLPSTSGNQKFPVIVFGHGFVMSWKAYQNLVSVIVPGGFVMAMVKTEKGISPSHGQMAEDLAFLNRQIQILGNTGCSVLFDRIDSMTCMMGHSMGGGCALLAASENQGIKSVVTLAACETRPSAIRNAAKISCPALFISGGDDRVTLPEKHQLPMFESIGSPKKVFISIIGGTHCRMANPNFLCNLAEHDPRNASKAEIELQHQVISQYLLLWLNAVLKNDPKAADDFDHLIINDSRITYKGSAILR